MQDGKWKASKTGFIKTFKIVLRDRTSTYPKSSVYINPKCFYNNLFFCTKDSTFNPESFWQTQPVEKEKLRLIKGKH